MSCLSVLRKPAAKVVLAAGFTAMTLPAAMATDYTKSNPLKVALVLNGVLGDKSFFDSAALGMKKAEAELPVSVKIIELSYDRGKWQPGIADAADSGYDVVMAGTFEMTDYIVELAKQYPKVKFIEFDGSPDFAKCGAACSNILAIQYKSSTASYLAGYIAAKISSSGILGTILGMEFPAINDYKAGFDQGAKAAKPNIQILNGVAGTFSDPNKGKEVALAQLNQNADIIFPIAGTTGLGALQAVKKVGGGKLAIGVDNDQAAVFAATDPAQADVIVTSVEKKVGRSLYLALKGTLDGALPYGQRLLLGLTEGAVGISKNAWYEKLVPPDVRAEVEAVEAKIASGAIEIKTDMKYNMPHAPL